MAAQNIGVTQKELAALAEPTPDSEKRKRPAPGRGNKMLTYVDARFVMDRFDSALGPENWQDEYRRDEAHEDGVVGRIGVLIKRQASAEWIWKEDVGTDSNIEGTKGSHSDAFKRAAVKWGVGRDLYSPDKPASKPVVTPARATAPTAAPTAAPVAAPVAAATGSSAVSPAELGAVAPTPAAAPAPLADPRFIEVPIDDALWVCPTHHAAVVWFAGTSKNGRSYPAFYACPEGKNCKERAPAGLKVIPAHLAGNRTLPF